MFSIPYFWCCCQNKKEVAAIDTMAPANRPCKLAKLKTRDSVSPEADSFYVTESAPALPAPLAALQGTLKLRTNAADSEKCLDSLVDKAEENEENCHTPKLQENKIPPVLCCPPAPVKRRSHRMKRKLPGSSPEKFFILADSDLQSLFGSDLAKRKDLPKSQK